MLKVLDCGVANVVLGKNTQKTVTSYAASFIESLNKALVDPTANVDNEWKKEVTPVEPTEPDSASRPAGDSAIEFHDDGTVVGMALASLRERGIVPGSRMENSSTPPSVVEVETIGEDGSISAIAIAEDGSKTITEVAIAFADMENWKLQKHVVEFMGSLTDIAPSTNDSYVDGLCKAYAQIALEHAVSSVGNMQVRAQLQPSKKLVADKDFPKGGLKLVFDSSKVVVAKSKPSGKAFPIIVPTAKFGNRIVYVVSSNSASLFAPAWHARTAGDAEVGNATVVFMAIDVSTSPDIEVTIKAPLVTNSTPLAAGAEIIADSKAAIGAWAATTEGEQSQKKRAPTAAEKKAAKKPKKTT